MIASFIFDFFIAKERQRTLLEERCTEMTTQVGCLERELQQLRPLQNFHASLQRQYLELQDRIHAATEDARKLISCEGFILI